MRVLYLLFAAASVLAPLRAGAIQTSDLIFVPPSVERANIVFPFDFILRESGTVVKMNTAPHRYDRGDHPYIPADIEHFYGFANGGHNMTRLSHNSKGQPSCPHCGGLHFGTRYDACPYMGILNDPEATDEQKRNAHDWINLQGRSEPAPARNGVRTDAAANKKEGSE